jgi:hypothetical protein
VADTFSLTRSASPLLLESGAWPQTALCALGSLPHAHDTRTPQPSHLCTSLPSPLCTSLHHDPATLACNPPPLQAESGALPRPGNAGDAARLVALVEGLNAAAPQEARLELDDAARGVLRKLASGAPGWGAGVVSLRPNVCVFVGGVVGGRPEGGVWL